MKLKSLVLGFTLASMVAAAVFATAARASEITGSFSFIEFGTATGTSGTDSVNNSPTPGVLTLADTFTNIGTGVSGLGESFAISSTPNIAEYMVQKTVTNDTSVTWTSFEIDFGTGIATGYCPTCPLTLTGTPSSLLGRVAMAPNLDEIVWSGLSFAPGDTETVTFDVDMCATCFGGWAIYETATTVPVPEPGSLILLGTGLTVLALIFARRRVPCRLSAAISAREMAHP
jgi:hypothetical protein